MVQLFKFDEKNINNDFIDYSVKASQLMEFINTLPSGLDTFVGEHGVRLSGGQKQRIALARAFYHSREVIILDEATNALDAANEAEIIEELRRLKSEAMIILITHSTRFRNSFDVILEIANGSITRSDLH